MDVIPNEIWLIILNYLPTYDIIQFCKAYKQFSYFLKDKNVVSNFDISCKYQLYNINLYEFISQDIGFEYIRSLNINSLYWVPLNDLRNLLQLLPNLEELRALDTRLGVREKDVKLYCKLKTLSISIEAQQFVVPCDRALFQNNLYCLRKFCLKIIQKKSACVEFYEMFSGLIGLEELWIYDADESLMLKINYDKIVYNLKFLKKLVIRSRYSIPFLEYRPFGLAKVFETRRFKSIVVCYVLHPKDQITPLRHLSIFEPCETPLEKAWVVLQSHQCELPCGPAILEKIYMSKTVKDIDFDELNFHHNRCFCNPVFVNACIDIIMSPNARKLKKLCIKSCILQFLGRTTRKPNTGNQISPFKNIVEHCKYIQELEIMPCTNCNVSILEGYSYINNLRDLKRLTIEFPSHLNGKFLEEVFLKCQKLEALNIISFSHNENLNKHLYASLKHAKQLVHFRLENVHINIDPLFTALAKIQTKKLQRIFIKCSYADNQNLKPLKNFLEANEQVVFLYTAISQNTSKQNNIIQALFQKFKQDNPAKIYFAKKSEGYFSGNYPVPEAHKDIMYLDTRVSLPDLIDF